SVSVGWHDSPLPRRGGEGWGEVGERLTTVRLALVRGPPPHPDPLRPRAERELWSVPDHRLVGVLRHRLAVAPLTAVTPFRAVTAFRAVAPARLGADLLGDVLAGRLIDHPH